MDKTKLEECLEILEEVMDTLWYRDKQSDAAIKLYNQLDKARDLLDTELYG